MAKIELVLDEYLLNKKERLELIDLVKRSGFKIEIECGDTHARGGISWSPADLIITVIGLSAIGFFNAIGEDIYEKLKKKIKLFLSKERPLNKRAENAYFSFDVRNIRLYFELNDIFIENIGISIDKIKTDFSLIKREINRLLDCKFEKILGKFESVTLIFDDEENRWIISHFNKDKF